MRPSRGTVNNDKININENNPLYGRNIKEVNNLNRNSPIKRPKSAILYR